MNKSPAEVKVETAGWYQTFPIQPDLPVPEATPTPIITPTPTPTPAKTPRHKHHTTAQM
jgi:hypothetical protein